MTRDTSSFEDMARVYDLFTGDTDRLSHLEALSLDAILRRYRSNNVLDCAAGTGIQALGLAALGYRVAASDISPTMIRVLRSKARARDLRLRTHVADFRTLRPWRGELFDAVICAGNSLGVLLTRGEVVRALRAMARNLHRPGGVVILGLRNYRKLSNTSSALVRRPSSTKDTQWYDIRSFRRDRVDVVYVRLDSTPDGPETATWTKSYSFLDPRGASKLLRVAGFDEVTLFDMKGLGPYRGGEWGFAVGAWKRSA